MSEDPRSEIIRRHLADEKPARRALQSALRAAGINKPARLHTLRHSFVSRLLQIGYDITTVQELPGHADGSTTMVYTRSSIGADEVCVVPRV